MKASCLAQDFVNFLDTEFDDDKRPLFFMENDIRKQEDLTRAWVVFSSLDYFKNGTTIGEIRRYIRLGQIVIHVNVPAGQKTAEMNELVYKISEHYEGKKIAGVIIDTVNCATTTDDTWFTSIVRITYKYYVTK